MSEEHHIDDDKAGDSASYLSLSDLRLSQLDDEGVSTETSRQQKQTEKIIEDAVARFLDRASVDPELPKLLRPQHVEFLERSLYYLSGDYECLDASRPWLCYWILHALQLLGHRLTDGRVQELVEFVARCQTPVGGFGGGPGQLAHLAATYAAVMALVTLGSERAFQVIDRRRLQRLLDECRNEDGSFCMHAGGETDIRGAYCAVAVARLTNVYTDHLFRNTAQWVASCQTYEGGFSGTPGLEAHGGYTFCGLATLSLLGEESRCDLPALMRWVSTRQMQHEGGFSGRTNKLVDACYAYWQGASFPIIHMILAKQGSKNLSGERWMFHQEALQNYLLNCCEREKGGFVDKPGKHRDFYHTCYALSGLSIAQNFHMGRLHQSCVVGSADNQLELVHPIFNIVTSKAVAATQYFSQLPVPRPEDWPDGEFAESPQQAEGFPPAEAPSSQPRPAQGSEPRPALLTSEPSSTCPPGRSVPSGDPWGAPEG